MRSYGREVTSTRTDRWLHLDMSAPSWADGDETRFVWARAFESEDERDRLYAAVYESDLWLTEMRPEVRRMAVTGSSRTTRLDPFDACHGTEA